MGFKLFVFEWGYFIFDFGVERVIFCNKRCRDFFKVYISYWKSRILFVLLIGWRKCFIWFY